MTTSAPVRPQQTLSERIARLDPEVVTPIGKVVLVTIAAFADRYTGENAWVSEATVIDLSGFGRTAIKAAYRHLHKIGALAYASGGQRPRGCDPRCRQRSIVIEHLTAKARRLGRQTTQSSTGTGSPGGKQLGRQAATTFPVSLSTRERHRPPAPESLLRGSDPIAAERGKQTTPTPWDRIRWLLREAGLSPSCTAPQSREAWEGMLRGKKIGEIRAAIQTIRKRMPVTLATCSPRDLEPVL